MGLLICAYDVSIGDKVISSRFECYPVQKYSGSWEFINCIEWRSLKESSDQDSNTYLRPVDIYISIQSVKDNQLIPDSNKDIFIDLLNNMKINNSLYIYLNI